MHNLVSTMNDKIKELLNLSMEPSGLEGLGGSYMDVNYEKFAELIVRECARVDSEVNNIDHEDGVTYNQTILEHFGFVDATKKTINRPY